MMKLEKFCYAVFFTAVINGAACTTTAPTVNTNSNQAVVSANANAANAASANAAATPTAAASPAAATAGSPSATVAALYQAVTKKDEKAFRSVLSDATLREFSAEAQAEGTKSLLEYWSVSAPPAKPYETRNERIAGDTALIEVKGGDSAAWTPARLIREKGEWKLDYTSATVNSQLQQQRK